MKNIIIFSVSCIAFLFLFVFKSTVMAQTGCLSVNNNLYTSNSGNFHMGAARYNWNGNESDPNRISNASNFKCLRSFAPKKSCYIRYSGFCFGYCYDVGEEVDYGPLPCPIDDYIPFTFAAIGSLGFFYIRRRNLLHSA